jgi:hypothetical protein
MVLYSCDKSVEPQCSRQRGCLLKGKPVILRELRTIGWLMLIMCCFHHVQLFEVLVRLWGRVVMQCVLDTLWVHAAGQMTTRPTLLHQLVGLSVQVSVA